MKVALLAGGLGTRIREETEFRPKPMVFVGGKPILWHIMDRYAASGFNRFVVCAGYRGEIIREYFREFQSMNSDFTVKLGAKQEIQYHDQFEEQGWEVTVTDTGEKTMTGGRLFKARRFLEDDTFLCTYGDGLADVDLKKLIEFHKSHGKIATITAVRPVSRFGVLDLSTSNAVNQFREKPQADGWINAGFFIFNKSIFNYLDENSILENEPLAALASENQLMAYRHEGFWQPMDTFRELTILNELWDSGQAPWSARK
jgi:glucose-1-phosphate cytidylyltransferase